MFYKHFFDRGTRRNVRPTFIHFLFSFSSHLVEANQPVSSLYNCNIYRMYHDDLLNLLMGRECWMYLDAKIPCRIVYIYIYIYGGKICCSLLCLFVVINHNINRVFYRFRWIVVACCIMDLQ